MPYRLRKAPRRDLYWVVGEDGSKSSHDPLPLETAKAQMAALYAAMHRTEGGVSIPKGKFIGEHKHLLGVLKRGKRSELNAEAKDQAAELSHITGGGPLTANGLPAESIKMLHKGYLLLKRHKGLPKGVKKFEHYVNVLVARANKSGKPIDDPTLYLEDAKLPDEEEYYYDDPEWAYGYYGEEEPAAAPPAAAAPPPPPPAAAAPASPKVSLKREGETKGAYTRRLKREADAKKAADAAKALEEARKAKAKVPKKGKGGSAQSGFVRRMLGEVKRKNILQKKSNEYAPITSLRKYSTMNSPAVFDPSKLTASKTSKWISDRFGAPKDMTQEYIDNELEGDHEKWKRGKLTFKGDTVSHKGKLYEAKEDTLFAEPPNAKVWRSVAQKEPAEEDDEKGVSGFVKRVNSELRDEFKEFAEELAKPPVPGKARTTSFRKGSYITKPSQLKTIAQQKKILEKKTSDYEYKKRLDGMLAYHTLAKLRQFKPQFAGYHVLQDMGANYGVEFPDLDYAAMKGAKSSSAKFRKEVEDFANAHRDEMEKDMYEKLIIEGRGRMKGGAVENDVTRAYAAMKPMTEEKWIANVKTYNPAAATPANYVKDYLTPWTRRRDAAIIDQQPGVGRAAVLPGYTEVRSQAEANALGPGAKYAIRNADGSVSSGTNRTLEDLARFDQEAVDKQVMRENQKKAAEEKYWANQSAVSRFFNRDVVGALTKVADFGSDLVGAVVPGVGKLIQKGYQGLAPPGSKYYSSAPLGQKILNTLGSVAPSPGQVASFLGSGHMHGLKGQGFFGDMFSAVTRPIGRIVGRVRDVLSGVRRDYPPSVRKVIKDIGAQPIARMVVRRDPIPSFLSYAVDLLTMGQFSKAQQDANYDKMFHLCIEFELAKGPRYVIEKNEVISVALARAPTKDTQIATVGMQSALDNTLNGLLKAGQGVMKERWFVYNALSNNCQDFILSILQGNQQLTPRLTEFVKQPLESIASSLPEYADKLFQGVTDAAAVGNVVIEGRGAFVPPSFEDMIKMGAKRVFALMKRNGYILPEFEKTGEGLVDKILKTGLSAVPVKFRRYFIRFQNGEYIKGYKYQGRGALHGGGWEATKLGGILGALVGTPTFIAGLANTANPTLAGELVIGAIGQGIVLAGLGFFTDWMIKRATRLRAQQIAGHPPAEVADAPVVVIDNVARNIRRIAERLHLPTEAPTQHFVFPPGSADVAHDDFVESDGRLAYLMNPHDTPPTPEKDFLTAESAAGMVGKKHPRTRAPITHLTPVTFSIGDTKVDVKSNATAAEPDHVAIDVAPVEGRGGGRVPTSKFQKQLEKAGISPAAYLKKAQDKAKKLGLSHTLLGFSSDDTHKLQIPNAAGKLIRFGAVGLGDHVLYSLAHDPTANEHREKYLARATKIKGNWKSDKYSPNSLAIGVLW